MNSEIEDILNETDEAPAESEVAPEAAPESQEQSGAAEQPPQQVPLGELLSERARRQQAEQELVAISERQAILDDRLTQLQGVVSPEPDVDDDPFGAISHQIEEQKEQIGGIQEAIKQNTEAARLAQTRTALVQMEQAFASKHTDYFQAMEHLKGTQMRQYAAMGLSNEEAEQRFSHDTAIVVDRAQRAGQNPVELAYNWAKETGFNPSNGQATGQQAPQQQSLNTIAEGMKNQGLAGSGSTPTGEITSDDLANMSPEEFDEFLEKAGDAGFAKVMGD